MVERAVTSVVNDLGGLYRRHIIENMDGNDNTATIKADGYKRAYIYLSDAVANPTAPVTFSLRVIDPVNGTSNGRTVSANNNSYMPLIVNASGVTTQVGFVETLLPQQFDLIATGATDGDMTIVVELQK